MSLSRAATPEHGYDFFVSYAFVDDARHGDAQHGWISAFVETLRIELLRSRYGRRMGINSWFAPRQLDGTIPLGHQIFSVLKQTRLLVIVLSEAFVESAWCRDERQAFFDAIRGHENAGGRVIVVDLGSVAHDERPPELRALPGFQFYRVADGGERQVLGYPIPSVHEDRDFYFAVRTLAQRIGDRLETLRPEFATHGSAPAPRPSAPVTVLPGPAVPTVYLAEPSDDLAWKYEEVVADLRSHGIRVVPDDTLPRGYDECIAEIERSMAEAQVFAQLVGAFPGKKLRDSDDYQVLLQHRCAQDAQRDRALTIMRWRDPAIDLARIEPERYRDAIGDPEIWLGPLEAFKAELRKQLLPPKRPVSGSTEAVAGRPRSFVLVQNDVRDEHAARELCQLLSSQLKLASSFPLRSDDPAEQADNRELLNDWLRECDALLLLYGEVKPVWIERQILSLRKVRVAREKPLRIVAVCMAPPPAKNDLATHDPDLAVVDCRDGFALERLRPILAPLLEDTGP